MGHSITSEKVVTLMKMELENKTMQMMIRRRRIMRKAHKERMNKLPARKINRHDINNLSVEFLLLS